MAGFFSAKQGDSKKEEKIIQLIRSWYYNNGKSIDEIIAELKEGWGLGEEQVRELLVRAGLVSPSDRFAALPESRKLTALDVVVSRDRFQRPAFSLGGTQSTANIKQMIDNAVNDLENRINKKLKLLEKNIADLSSQLSEHMKTVEQLKQEIEKLKQMIDEKSLISLLNRVRSDISQVIDKIENIRLLLNQNKDEIERLESTINLLKFSKPQEQVVQQPQPEQKPPTAQQLKRSFEDIFKPKASAVQVVSSVQQEEDKFEKEIQEILKILEE
ncbi:MAG: hypothetical protein GXO42_02710 [bacterium]|nr:hypothetical protein [bacterium]